MVELCDYHLYYAKFQFPEDCIRPTIAIRTKDTMICPLSSRNEYDEEESQWLWGVELKQAVRLCDARVWLSKRIRYRGEHTHREFIQFMFSERQKYPESEHPVKNRLFKLLMNSLYGKHG